VLLCSWPGAGLRMGHREAAARKVSYSRVGLWEGLCTSVLMRLGAWGAAWWLAVTAG
jgi:hypothetical protein